MPHKRRDGKREREWRRNQMLLRKEHPSWFEYADDYPPGWNLRQ